jgi:hypothetical protein
MGWGSFACREYEPAKVGVCATIFVAIVPGNGSFVWIERKCQIIFLTV